jgi:hypothetical protein
VQKKVTRFDVTAITAEGFAAADGGFPVAGEIMGARRLWFSLCLSLRCSRKASPSRGVRPVPRGKPSGLPYYGKFVNVAQQAGLRQTIHYGRAERKEYILESVGVAPPGSITTTTGGSTRYPHRHAARRDPPEASLRLYRNQRNGSFADVTDKAGLRRAGWASSAALGITTTTATRTFPHVLGQQCALPQQRRRHLQRCSRGRRIW